MVKTHLISGTQSGVYKSPASAILKYYNTRTLGVIMLPIPGASKQQHGPDFQRYQRCSGVVHGVGGLDSDNSDLEAGNESGKQQMEYRTYIRDITWGHCCQSPCTTGRPLYSLLLNNSLKMQFTWSWETQQNKTTTNFKVFYTIIYLHNLLMLT